MDLKYTPNDCPRVPNINKFGNLQSNCQGRKLMGIFLQLNAPKFANAKKEVNIWWLICPRNEFAWC